MIRRLGAALCGAGLGLVIGWVPNAPAASAASNASNAPTASAALGAPSATSPSGPVSGWWQQANQSPVAAPADPSTPPDGIQVTTGATGVVAVGAVRFVPPTAGADGVVTLRLATGSASSPSADLVLHACPATNAWKPVQNGPWSARVTYRETACITGKAAADGKSVSFAVPASAQRNGRFDLGIEALSSTPVTLAFAHPVASDLSLAARSSANVPSGSSSAASAPAPSESSSAASSSASSGAAAPSDSPIAAPVAETSDAASSVGPGLGAPITTPNPTGRQSALGATTTRRAPLALRTRPVSDHRGTRIGAVLLLLGIGAALFWFGGQPARPPRMVGSLGARMAGAGSAPVAPAPVRGIGRFARPREGSVPGRG